MSDKAKINVAKKAIEYIPEGCILGVGSGTTVNFFIKELSKKNKHIKAAIASSSVTEDLLKKYNIPVISLNEVDLLELYIDGTDAIDKNNFCIKGGGGALTQEKIIATMAKKWICIADKSKYTKNIAQHSIAVEVIPSARSFVARKLVQLKFIPIFRENFITDNHNIILDIKATTGKIDLTNFENTLNQIPGVVENGIFIKRTPDTALFD